MLWLTLMACGFFEAEAPEAPEAAVAEAPEAEVAVEAAVAEDDGDSKLVVDPKAGLGRINGAALAAEAPPSEPPPFDAVISRKGIGFIGHDTTRKQLERKLGKDAVREHSFDQGEGIMMPGLEILPDTPWTLRLQTDGKTIERIEVVGEGYRLGNGLHVGSDFAELKRSLGNFEVYGWGWDMGGTVVSEPPSDEGYQLAVRTEPAKRARWSAKAQQVLHGGDQRFASTHEAMDELDPHVSGITLVWRDGRR